MDEKSEMIARIQYLIANDSKNKSQILRELHLSTSTLSDWEKGKGNPSTSAIIKLAKYFNVSSDYILFGTEQVMGKALSPQESKWLQLYPRFSESQRQSLSSLSQLPSPEKNLCTAFICGVIAEKEFQENEEKE